MQSRWYVLARVSWQGAKYLWTAIIIVILINVASSVFAGKQSDVINTTAVSFILWLSTRGFNQALILSVIGLFIVFTLASWLTTFILGENNQPAYTPPPEVQAILDYIKKDLEVTKQRAEVQQTRDKETFTQYLRSVEESCKNIRPRGFAQLSRAVVFADVPLNATFVPLQVVSDEPIYDAPWEQRRQLEAMRQRTDLSIEEREAYLQRLRIIWQSQLRHDVNEEEAQQVLLLAEVLPRLTPSHPAAILLGAPGSGKTTFLRWLALHMAHAALRPGTYHLPNGFGREQVPILIQTKEYAERLSKEYLTLKQFLILQWSRFHPNLAVKLLDELAQGRCLVLFDGLEQGTAANIRRQVIEAIHEFIADYSSEDPNRYNRFIITSRITDSEPGDFAEHTHYTLLDLTKQQIEQILRHWYLALTRYRAMSVKGMQQLTEHEEAEVRADATRQQEQLSDMLRNKSDLMQLATNPLTLTIMILLQTSGRNLVQHHIELYQMITRTMLDSWNRESGRKMFSDEEMPLAEQLLGNLAFRLHDNSTMLTFYDVMMTTRQTLATFYQRQPREIRENDITQLIKMLRMSSGLFVEGGEDLFYFANRKIQDYYVVQYLLHMRQEDLQQFAFQHYHLATWREPLLFTLNYKIRQLPLTAQSRQPDEPAAHKESPTQAVLQPSSEERARSLQALQRVRQLTKAQVEELLAACNDTRPLHVGTVQELAWKILSNWNMRQSVVMEDEAWTTVLHGLDSRKAPICEGAAILLQQSKALPDSIQKRAVEKILQMLIDNNIHQRFYPLSYIELLRFNNTLFETLKGIAGHSG